MANIFDVVTAPAISSHWETLNQDRRPYLGEVLFPSRKKIGIDLSWVKGSSGLPVVLSLSAFDVQAVPMQRIGFDRVSARMPFFKNSKYIDEELRRDLNLALETGNQYYIKSTLDLIFDDVSSLIDSAAVARERMRMMLLTTGTIVMESNGQSYTYDYGIRSEQKPTANEPWSEPDTDIISEIQTWQDEREDETGVRPTRAICSRKTFGHLLKNKNIRSAVWGNNLDTPIRENNARAYLREQLGLSIEIYTKRYIDETGATKAFVPDGTFVLIPPGDLGYTWLGATPEESDLMTSNATENMSIVDTGVAVATKKEWDPVNVETKVTQIALPSFETADQIVIADVAAA